MNIFKAEFERRVEAAIEARLHENHDVGQAHRRDEAMFGIAARALKLILQHLRYDEARMLYWIDPTVWELSQDCGASTIIQETLRQLK